MTPDHDFGVIEMGANHLLEIDFLCRIALPDFGYITNFGRVHLEGFGSYEGVIEGKTELYRYLQENGKKIFVNSEDAIQMDRSEGMDRILIGGNETDFEIAFLGADPFVRIDFEGTVIESQLIGDYNYDNIKAAACIGKYFGTKTTAIKNAIEGFVPDNNRSQIINRGSNKIILDAYNANPNSMEAAIKNLRSLSDPKKVAILGDMFEIGRDSMQEHQQIAEQAIRSGFSKIYLIGENFAKTSIVDDRVLRFSSFEDFSADFQGQTHTATTFLIKASRGMALERVMEYL
jgi:UDP-N-acetylmuramoyl-tripeptide--D-alanyl-D-alanine ligase